jgi:hypothetical protein
VVRVLSKAIASDDRVTAKVVLFQPFEKFFGLFPNPMGRGLIE